MSRAVSVLILVSFLIISSFPVKAQDDCCGIGTIFSSLVQSGIYGGYGMQQYSAEGLNDVIHSTPGLDENFKDFGTARGWRVGANLVGFRQKEFLVALKFYYQSVRESQEASGTYNGEDAIQKLTLDINNWNLGMSLSYIFNPNFDLRIFDIYLTWTNAKFTNEISTANAPPKDKYESPDTHTGFTADAGIVWYPFPPYLSIEVLGGYSLFAVESLNLEDSGSSFPTNTDFIDGGGFFAMAVLTVGIPFN